MTFESSSSFCMFLRFLNQWPTLTKTNHWRRIFAGSLKSLCVFGTINSACLPCICMRSLTPAGLGCSQSVLYELRGRCRHHRCHGQEPLPRCWFAVVVHNKKFPDKRLGTPWGQIRVCRLIIFSKRKRPSAKIIAPNKIWKDRLVTFTVVRVNAFEELTIVFSTASSNWHALCLLSPSEVSKKVDIWLFKTSRCGTWNKKRTQNCTSSPCTSLP